MRAFAVLAFALLAGGVLSGPLAVAPAPTSEAAAPDGPAAAASGAATGGGRGAAPRGAPANPLAAYLAAVDAERERARPQGVAARDALLGFAAGEASRAETLAAIRAARPVAAESRERLAALAPPAGASAYHGALLEAGDLGVDALARAEGCLGYGWGCIRAKFALEEARDALHRAETLRPQS